MEPRKKLLRLFDWSLGSLLLALCWFLLGFVPLRSVRASLSDCLCLIALFSALRSAAPG